mgnify:CR=1 FL=1
MVGILIGVRIVEMTEEEDKAEVQETKLKRLSAKKNVRNVVKNGEWEMKGKRDEGN